MRVLNDEWEDAFREWYPGFRSLPRVWPGKTDSDIFFAVVP